MSDSTAILMPAYNHYEYTKVALGSLLFCTRTPFHVFLIDDCSVDETKELQSTSWMTVIRHSSHSGITAAWNTGMEAILQGDWKTVFIINNDVLFGPDWLQHLLHGLDKGYAFVGPVSNRPGGSGPQTTRQLVTTYLPDYKESDDPIDVSYTSFRLQGNPTYTEASNLNGFCFGGFVTTFIQTWESGGLFDATKRDLGSEDSFFFAYADKHPGNNCLVCSASFVYHYKGITLREIYGERHYGNLKMASGGMFAKIFAT